MGESNLQITEYLNSYYLPLDNFQFAVLLKGNWGSGKTFYIKTLIEKWNLKSIQYQSEENSIIINSIYVSLNGISELKVVNTKIKEKIHPFLHSKTAKVTKAIFKTLLTATTRVNFDVNNN